MHAHFPFKLDNSRLYINFLASTLCLGLTCLLELPGVDFDKETIVEMSDAPLAHTVMANGMTINNAM